MPLAFESVSYSYGEPERDAKRQKKNRKRADRRTASTSNDTEPFEDAPSLEHHEQPKWGTSPDEPWALKDISFELVEGEFFGIAGHTGSGKSTLIQHMNGLVHPTRGRVTFNGKDLADKQVAQACRGKVGLVFQYPEHQLFAPTVFDDVAFGPRNMGLSGEELDACVAAALESVHLDADELGSKSPFELSGGQQRRVAFAGVLAMQPEVLVLDEPVAGLDPVAREEFLELIDGLHDGGLTVVMVSHSMDDLARLSDRILVLNEGRTFALGTPEEIFAAGLDLKSIGLGLPAAQQFAVDLSQSGFPLAERLYDATALADEIARLYRDSPEEVRMGRAEDTSAEGSDRHA